MATKVSTFQIQNINPSQMNPEGAIPGDTLVARPSNGGLTLTWSPTSILPRTALQGQVLMYNYYTSTWVASSINTGGATALPLGTSNDINKVLTWNGAQWIIASPQGTVTNVGISNSDGSITVGTPSFITTSGTIPLTLGNVSLSKLNQTGATANQVLTWNGGTNTWSPSAVSNSVGNIKAFILFNGKANPLSSGILTSRNITSLVDNGTGDYTINFAPNLFSNTNYLYSFGISKNQTGQFTSSVVEISRTIGTMRIQTGFAYTNDIFNLWDTTNISLIFLG